MLEFWIKRGSVLPEIEADLKNSKNEDVDISGSTVYFAYRRFNTTTKIVRAGTIVSASPAKVKYAFVSEDVVTAGSMMAEWQIVNNGKITIYPNRENMVVRVVDSMVT